MKKKIFAITISLFALLSCGSDEDGLQEIDQIMTFYIKDSSGKDLLNPTDVGAYSQIRANDVFGENDSSPVSFSGPTMQADSTYFIEYTAGATRNLVSADAEDNRIYNSKIALNLRKKVNDTAFQEVLDTMEIQYRWSPSRFEIAKVFYNKNEVFTKTPTSGNTFTITKIN